MSRPTAAAPRRSASCRSRCRSRLPRLRRGGAPGPSFSTPAPHRSFLPDTCPERCTWAFRASSRPGAGRCSPAGAPIVLVTEDEERVAESQTRLARVGLETVAGFLAGGIAAWDLAGLPLARTEQVGVDELAARIAEGGAGQVLDVRRPAEWKAGHIASAVHIPLNELSSRAAELDRVAPDPHHLRQRLPLLDRHEPARAERLHTHRQRRRRHDGLDSRPLRNRGFGPCLSPRFELSRPPFAQRTPAAESHLGTLEMTTSG